MSTSSVNARADRNEQSLGTPHHFRLQLGELLSRHIERDMGFGDRLLTEEELCDQFGVSHETVPDAWHSLEGDGIIAPPRGQGTIVERPPRRAKRSVSRA